MISQIFKSFDEIKTSQINSTHVIMNAIHVLNSVDPKQVSICNMQDIIIYFDTMLSKNTHSLIVQLNSIIIELHNKVMENRRKEII